LDLWEERKATCTYSAAAVYAGLKAASNLAEIVGFEDEGLRFESAAGEVKNGILDHLYDPSLGRFLRSVNPRDETVDSSLLAISSFGVLPPQDQRYLGTVKAVEDQLWVKGDIGGVARYPGDGYLRVSNQFTGNPWILTTLYLAISRTDMDDLVGAKQLIEWATDRATSTNLLPEQVNAYDGSPIGVLPLAWSHAAYILAVKRLAAKLSDKGAKWDVLS
jgi:GH15 family glucan-1,4-alpha-glucosidase